MKKKLTFLAVPILALGLMVGPISVSAEPRVVWENHEIYTQIQKEGFVMDGKKYTVEDRILKKLEVGIEDISYDKFQEIDGVIKEYFETLTKDETVKKHLEEISGVVMPEKYTRTEEGTPLNKRIEYFVNYQTEKTANDYSKAIIEYISSDKKSSVIIKLEFFGWHEHITMERALKKVGITELPKSMADLDRISMTTIY